MDSRRRSGIVQWQVLFGLLIVLLGVALTGIGAKQH